MKLKNALLSLTALVIAAPFAFAQTTVSTEPIGFITVDIVGDGGTSLIAPGMVSPLEFQGVVTGATGNDVAVNATLEVDAYAGTHYLEVFEGTNAGALSMIVSNTADTFTTSDALTVAADDVVRVRAFMTPGTIFGNGADAGFAADGTDIMLIWDAAAQSPTIVLWDSASARWEDS